jgi:predicted transcriptional regulator of viral defense system
MKRSFHESQAKLFAIAESQGGFFTAKQAQDAGFDRKNYAYHVRAGNWQREQRGIFRLTNFPLPEHSDLVLWSLWSRDRDGQPQGIYSHQTALSLSDLSDVMPAKLHMTVPSGFRKSAAIPAVLVLHYADLSPNMIEDREGFRVTRPIQTILDLCKSQNISADLLKQAFSEARERGLITAREISKHRQELPSFLIRSRQGVRIAVNML